MTKKPNAKRILAEVSRIGRSQGTQSKKNADAALTRKAANKVLECLTRAFEVAGRDIESEKDWKLVTMWLAVSVFAGRGVGHPLKWTRKRMLRLIRDVEGVKADRRARGLSETDLACCRDLLGRPPYNKFKGKRYQAFTASALRRRLVEARRTTKALAAVEVSQASVYT